MKLQIISACLPFALLAACSSETETKDTEAKKSQTAPAIESAAQEDGGLCLASGPQTPRDISNIMGLNPIMFALAPASTQMNLCSIHTHTNAEHKGPGFNVFVGDGDHGGYACNETAELTEAELADPAEGPRTAMVPSKASSLATP